MDLVGRQNKYDKKIVEQEVSLGLHHIGLYFVVLEGAQLETQSFGPGQKFQLGAFFMFDLHVKQALWGVRKPSLS